jgi:hypothetical protein
LAVAKSRDKAGRETRKPSKDKIAKSVGRGVPVVPMSVDIVPKKRKTREDEDEE